MDRIEFILRNRIIREDFKSNDTSEVLSVFLKWTSFILLFVPLGYIAFGFNFIYFLSFPIRITFFLFIIGILISIGMDLITYFNKKKLLNDLEKKFFEVKIKE